MLKHYARPAWDEGYEYIGMHDESSPPANTIECTEPYDVSMTGYIRYDSSTSTWYWPTSAVLRYERIWRDQQWPAADVGLMLVQDSNSKSVGTIQDWQDYKNALRDWPDNPLIDHDSVNRPQKPTA